MNIRQLFNMTALAVMLSGCGDDQPAQQAPLTPAEIEKQKREQESQTRSNLQRLEMYSKFEQAGGVGAYPVQNDAPFTMVDFDSAGIRTHVLLDNPSTYEFIMKRLSKNKKDDKQYELTRISLEANYWDNSRVNFYHAVMFHVGEPRALGPWKNDTRTNLKELQIYREYGNVVSPSSGQADVEETSADRFASYVEIQQKGQPAMNISIGAAFDVVEYHKTLYGSEIKSITREQTTFPDANSEKTGKYVIVMSEPKKDVASTPKP